MNNGSSTRSKYDKCIYTQDLQSSTDPLAYRMYSGMYENCSKCINNKNQFWRPFDKQIVDRESELTNRTRPLSYCNKCKYSPFCKHSNKCVNTFDKSNPIVLPQYLCPIVYDNTKPRTTSVGYTLNTEPFCNNETIIRTPSNYQELNKEKINHYYS